MMNKKGQVFILAAMLLLVVLYGLSAVPNFSVQQQFKGDFEKLSNNYEIEGSKLVNSVLSSGGDITESFTNFTVFFMSYSKSQTPNFGVIASLSYKNSIRIGNYLKKPVLIDLGDGKEEEINGCFDKIPASLIFKGLVIDLPAAEIKDIQTCFTDIPYKENIRVGFVEKKEPSEVIWYKFKAKPNALQLMTVSLLEEGPQRKVNIAGEGYIQEGEHEVKGMKIKEVLDLEENLKD